MVNCRFRPQLCRHCNKAVLLQMLHCKVSQPHFLFPWLVSKKKPSDTSVGGTEGLRCCVNQAAGIYIYILFWIVFIQVSKSLTVILHNNEYYKSLETLEKWLIIVHFNVCCEHFSIFYSRFESHPSNKHLTWEYSLCWKF